MKTPARPAGRRSEPAQQRGAAEPGPANAAARKSPARAAQRAALTRESIVAAALALVDAEGLAGLSTRKLGERLGVEAMSIYHYFPSKQHLLDALVDHALASIPLERPGPDPEGQLRRLAYDYRAMARRFPRLYPLVALHRLNTPTGVALIERVLELVHARAHSDELAARQFRAFGYFLTGAALDETSGYAKGPSAAEPVDDAYIGAHCPRLAAAAPYFKAAHWDATFALGLEALLDGFRAADERARR
jgi:AcrR family transcriptional regulator